MHASPFLRRVPPAVDQGFARHLRQRGLPAPVVEVDVGPHLDPNAGHPVFRTMALLHLIGSAQERGTALRPANVVHPTLQG